MSTGTKRQFPIYAEGFEGYGDTASIEPIANGEPINATTLNRPSENLRERNEVERGLFEDLLYLADADRALIVAGPGTVTWPGSTTAGRTGIFTLSDTLYILPALTPGAVQVAPVPPIASSFGTATLLRDGDSLQSILVTSLLRGYKGGDKINLSVVSDAVYSCTLADEATMSIVIKATASTTLSAVITSLNGLLNANSENVCTAVLINGAAGSNLILRPQGPRRMLSGYDAEGHALTPAQLAAFFAIPGNALAEGDSLCVQYSTMIDTSPGTSGGRRQSLVENSNTSITSAMLFNSRVTPDRLVNAIPICKVVNGRLCFISGQQIQAGVSGFDLGAGITSVALTDFMSSVIFNDGGTRFSQGAHVDLTFAVNAGTFWMNGVKTVKSADTVVLASSTTNYIYIDVDGDLKSSTLLSTAAALPKILLYRAVTAVNSITAVTDVRRYHTRVNTRDFVTVGTSGDFDTLEKAVAWVTFMRTAGELKPLRIVVEGTVTMSSQIVLTTGVSIEANDPASGQINTPSGTAAFAVSTGTVDKVTFKNINFVMPTTIGTSAISITGTASCNYWEIDNCLFSGGGDAYTISAMNSTGTHVGWRVTNNRFFGASFSDVYGSLGFEKTSNTLIEGNNINQSLSNSDAAGILLSYGSSNNTVSNNIVSVAGLSIYIGDSNLAGSLFITSTNNQVTGNTISNSSGTAINDPSSGSTIYDRNYFIDCGPSGTNGVIEVGSGEKTLVNNRVTNWTGGAALTVNALCTLIVQGNIMTTNQSGATLGVNTGALVMVGPAVSDNVIDLSTGAAAGAGKALGIAINMPSSVSAVVKGNSIRNVGSTGSNSTGVIKVGGSSTISGNAVINCRGVGYVAGAGTAIAGNVSDHVSCGLGPLQSTGKAVLNGFQRTESLTVNTTAAITLDDGCATLYVACPGGTTHVIGGLTGNEKGRRVEVWNTGIYTITIAHEEGTIGTAAQRIHCSGTANLTLPAKGCAIVTYDDNISRWRAVIVG